MTPPLGIALFRSQCLESINRCSTTIKRARRKIWSCRNRQGGDAPRCPPHYRHRAETSRNILPEVPENDISTAIAVTRCWIPLE